MTTNIVTMKPALQIHEQQEQSFSGFPPHPIVDGRLPLGPAIGSPERLKDGISFWLYIYIYKYFNFTPFRIYQRSK
jgi:hypothetical protein